MPEPVNPDQVLGEIFTSVETLVSDDLTDGTLHDLGQRLDMALRIISNLKVAKEALEIALIDSMPEDTLKMDGVLVVRERVTRSTWKPSGAARLREDIAHNVASKLSLDIATGEVDIGRRAVIENAVKELWTIIPAFSTMKVDGRERFDLKISHYRDFSDGYNIRVVVEDGPG